MKTPVENMSKEELDKMQQWVKEQKLLDGFATRDLVGLALYKLFELEQRLKQIEYNQQTHWTNPSQGTV